jgi:Putative transposase
MAKIKLDLDTGTFERLVERAVQERRPIVWQAAVLLRQALGLAFPTQTTWQLGRQNWNVHIRERYPHGHGVLIYLARYLRGGPIAPQRLVSCDGQQVVFPYEERAKLNGGQPHQRTMRLPLEQFLGRWLLHVPPARAVPVRCWGLYAHTQGEELARCRQQLGQGPVQTPEPLDGLREGERGGEAHPDCFPVCRQRLVCTALLPRAGAPTPAETEWEQVA